MLMDLATQQGVKDLLVSVGDFIGDRMPCYRWPGKTAYSFSLREPTEEGRFTLRSYVTLYVHQEKRGTLLLTLAPRAVEVATTAVKFFEQAVPSAAATPASSWAPFQVEIDSSSWPSMREYLAGLLEALVTGWKQRAAKEAEESDGGEDASATPEAS